MPKSLRPEHCLREQGIRLTITATTTDYDQGCVIIGGSLGEFALPTTNTDEWYGEVSEPSFPRMTQPWDYDPPTPFGLRWDKGESIPNRPP